MPEVPSWPVEVIPNEHYLLYRIRNSDVRDGNVVPGAFINTGTEDNNRAMSVDWDYYSTPAETLKRVENSVHGNNNPDDHGVISMNAGKVREIKGQTVIHDPKLTPPFNRAHTKVAGSKSKRTKARAQFMMIYSWEIEPKNKFTPC